jgi:hypothetical protein
MGNHGSGSRLPLTGKDSRKSGESRREVLMARASISVDHEVFEEFSSEAKRKDRTMSAFANQSLSTMAKISAEGGEPGDLYRLWRSVSLMKQVDVITLPSDFVDELIAKMYAADKEGLLKMFDRLGSNLVGILKLAAKDIDELAGLATDFSLLVPIKRFTVSRSQDDGVFEVDVVGAGRRIESTECSFVFLQSVLNGYGYVVTKHEMNLGTIMMWVSKRNSA